MTVVTEVTVTVVAMMTVVAVMTVVHAVAVATAATVATTVPAAGGCVSRGGEGRSRQSDSGNSGSEDRTLHRTSPGFLQSDHRPGVCPISALRSPLGM